MRIPPTFRIGFMARMRAGNQEAPLRISDGPDMPIPEVQLL